MNRDKVTSKDAEECVDPTISQSIVARREVISVRNGSDGARDREVPRRG